MEKKLSHHDLVQKPCLLVSLGKLIPGPVDLAVSSGFRLQGIIMEGGDMIAFEDLASCQGDAIAVKEGAQVIPPRGRSLLGLRVMSREGRSFGTVQDFIFDAGGQVTLLKLGDIPADGSSLKASLPAEALDALGEDVLFVTPEAEKLLHYEEREEGYGEMLGKKLTASVSDLTQLFNQKMKQVDKEAISQDLHRITDQVNREFTRILDGILDQVSSKRMTFADDDYSAILMDLQGHTVSKPILDKRGEVIIMPGQAITEERVRRVVEAERVADLYRLAIKM